ncbi:tail fiber domain-containing protein [Hydrogenimonas urashimensis]|uniref:tail fiber domain-containing protein n=1 Tax=Hydrogenimonas urashimensis TaxID=2740515 RepID=UPI0019161F59|nr:tail fiber domain-containing protein [Hydrogenimonas urashimensis]
MADWNLPTLTSNYTDFLNQLKERDDDLATMTYGSNQPTGAIRYNSSNHKFEKWNGSAWETLAGITWANNRTDGQYIWIRRDSGVPLFATRCNNSNGNIAEFHWSSSSLSDGTIRCGIYGSDAESKLILYDPNNSNKQFYISVNSGIYRLSAYDYSSSSPINFYIGYNNTQTVTIPAHISALAGMNIDQITCRTGQQLILNAGESEGKVSEQTNEYVYVNAESGLSVNTPDSAHSNWQSGYTVKTTVITGEHITIDGHTAWHDGNAGQRISVQSFVAGKDCVIDPGSGSNNENVYIGYRCARKLGSGNSRNVAIGSTSFGDGANAVTGYNNVALGEFSLQHITSGISNTGCGGDTLTSLTTGDHNTAIGFNAGANIQTGSNNTAIGYKAGTDTSPHQFSSSDSNKIVVGNNDITNAYIKVSWTVTSDERDKTDIAPIQYGLDYITRLQPKQFRFDDRSRYWVEKEDGTIDKSKEPDGSKKDEKFMWGFISQDILEIEEELGIEDSPVVEKDNKEKLGLKETSLIPILVNAVKELKAEVDSLKDEIAQLKENCCS